MIDFKQKIAEQISKVADLPEEEIYGYIEIPTDEKMGDFAFPCFKLAKELKKAPQMIAEDLKQNMTFDENLMKEVNVVNGYLNFSIQSRAIAETVLKEIHTKQEHYGESTIGQGKNIVIDYSAPNIAKPFHIGHLRSTVIGGALYKIYKALGYHCVGINHLGDYGTQFGKLIEGYKRWGTEYNIEENPIDELTKIYVRINNLCKEDESALEACRDNFKKLEDGDEYCTNLWTKFRELSLKEFKKVYDMLQVDFDSWNGEAFYSDKMQEVIDILKEKDLLIPSEGAMVVDLASKDMPPCIIEKTNGSTTYATRDLAAILYRSRTYDFTKAIYITSYEQILHFRQIFEVAKNLNLSEKYTEGLVHVPFGMVQLKTGKMSTREGNIIKLEELLNEAISRVEEIMKVKNPDLENKEEIAKKIGIGAVIFNDLYNSRIKDEIFDWDTMLNFNGETGPYMQYIYVRTKSLLEKAKYTPDIAEVDFSKLEDEASIRVLKQIYHFGDSLKQAAEKYEPYVVARYLIGLAQSFSSFYNENKIIGEEKSIENARLYLTYATGMVLKVGAELLGIQMPDKM